jgi:hypothetical protein
MYQTDLAQTPLPEILVTIHRYRAPGMIECRNNDVIKRVYLDRGDIIFATSNQLSDSLGDKLLREGKITKAQYDASVELLHRTGKRHGVTLLEMKLLEPKDLFVALRDQIQEIVWSIFEWTSGTVAFTPGREKHLEFVKIEIPIAQAILRGARRLPDAKRLLSRLGTRTTVLERTPKPPVGASLTPDEQSLLDAVDGRRPLYELVNFPPMAPSDNARILYALFALQLIGVKQARTIKVQVRTDSGRYKVE